MRILRLLLFPIILLSLAGCGNIVYISKLAWHQGYIAFHSVLAEEVLGDERVSGAVKERIHFVEEVKRYGEERLGLARTKSYSKFFEMKGPVLYVITASEKDRLRLYTWDFPIAGRVTYKGFFSIEDARKEKTSLEERGYDTFLQQVGAYSTLGWLRDPIFSSMLEWSDMTLANVILHEMTHATIYFKGKTDLNEQVATFLGNRGAVDFLRERFGPGSIEVAKAIHHQEDDLLFSTWIDKACERLSRFYGQGISRDEKLSGREEVFRSLKEEFKEVKAQFKAGFYEDFEKKDLNNAVFLAYRRYFDRLEMFETLYGYLGKDLRRVTQFLKEMQASGEEPASFLERWMRKRGYRSLLPAMNSSTIDLAWLSAN